MVSVAEFLAYPFSNSFSTVDTDKLQTLLDFADRNYCNGSAWTNYPAKRKDAVVLIASHIGYLQWFAEAEIVSSAIAVRGGTGGSNKPQAMEEYFKLTIYGVQYLDLLNQTSATQSADPSFHPKVRTGFAF